MQQSPLVAQPVTNEASVAIAPRAADNASKQKSNPERPAKHTTAEQQTAPLPAVIPPDAQNAETITAIANPATSAPPSAAAPAQDNSHDALSALVSHLTTLYERGDLEGFLALFDEDARAELGGKERIRSDYEKLFRTSEARKLNIYDLNWVKEGDRFRGKGSFQASVMRKGESAAHLYNGTITLEVSGRNEAPLILGIFHKAS